MHRAPCHPTTHQKLFIIGPKHKHIGQQKLDQIENWTNKGAKYVLFIPYIFGKSLIFSTKTTISEEGVRQNSKHNKTFVNS